MFLATSGVGWTESLQRQTEIATTNLPTKLEVSISIHYKDMKRDTKC